ncbi:hypothetical protein DTO207G8_9011 [Paecilomyces variotii]|nr:hypothetical protein DTO169E5_6753 [Paecilomyces variotii]KAJ9246386.1 hypothetical protein DTO207G8_9011 [Paecilomyces variotii]KAJ9387111.1 hypothetical protein DTO063F5_3206 [Paecilomyces variotii]
MQKQGINEQVAEHIFPGSVAVQFVDLYIIAIAQGLALPAVSTVIHPRNEYLPHAIGWKSRPCRVGDVKCLPENPTGHGWSPTGQQ